ncbi:MAG: hypothetical protein PHN74_02155 [Candidatus Pacebacteria bacterium]|nr:hypothetical protein [Candidatus Paceibacterota bacterium]
MFHCYACGGELELLDSLDSPPNDDKIWHGCRKCDEIMTFEVGAVTVITVQQLNYQEYQEALKKKREKEKTSSP